MFEQPGPRVYKLDVLQTTHNVPTVDRASRQLLLGMLKMSGQVSPKARGFADMNKNKQHIVMNNGSNLSDSQSVGLGSPTHQLVGGNTNDGYQFQMNGQMGDTPRYTAPYQKIVTGEYNQGLGNNFGSPKKNVNGFGFVADAVQNTTGLRRDNRVHTFQGHNGGFSPLTPQPPLVSHKSLKDENTPNNFLTPQLSGRHRAQTMGTVVAGEGYPGNFLATPKQKQLSRQNSDHILEEESIFFFKTNL